MHVAEQNLFWPVLAIFILCSVLALATLRRDRRDLTFLGRHHFILDPAWVFGRRVIKTAMLMGALGLAMLGAVRLQGKPVPEDLQLRGIDVMIVLDLSKSMLTQDMVPNRLEAAKKAILNWLQGRDGDRVGLTVFAGEALVQVPLTLDLEAVSLVLNRDDVDAVDRGGTDIGKGIRMALASFPKENPDKRGRAILLITDGEITDGASNLTEACLEAKEMKVPILAVGIGTRQGRPIPDGASFWGEANYKRDRAGNVVISRLDEKTLTQIAEMTGGTFIPADSAEGLAGIDQGMSGLAQTQMKGQGIVRRRELAPLLGVCSAGVLALSCLI